MRLRWECIPSPSQLLFLPLFLRLLVLFSAPHNKRHLDRRRRTSPPQWRDPCISSFALALAFAFLLLPLPFCSCLCRCCCTCLCCCCCSFYVVILSAAKNPRIFKGSTATGSVFLPHHPTPSFRPKRLTALS